MKHLTGVFLGILYGGFGFGLGAVYLFCESLKTVWCSASKPLILFYPPGFIGSELSNYLLNTVSFTTALTISVIAMAFLFGIIGYLIESAVCGLIRRPKRN